MKKCCTCKLTKKLIFFSRKKAAKDGYSYKCKECHNLYSKNVWYKSNKEKQIASSGKWRKNNYIRYKAKMYDIPEGVLKDMFDNAKGICCICKTKQNLVVDHCHITGRVRGLLCSKCNFGLGFFKDSILSLESAIEYLKK